MIQITLTCEECGSEHTQSVSAFKWVEYQPTFIRRQLFLKPWCFPKGWEFSFGQLLCEKCDKEAHSE